MSADQAFGNLIIRNALTIPPIETNYEAGGVNVTARLDRSATTAVHTVDAGAGRMPKKPEIPSAARTGDERDAAPLPACSTDTELLAAPWLDEMDDARLSGARIVGRNAAVSGEYDAEATKETLLLNRASKREEATTFIASSSSKQERTTVVRPSNAGGIDLSQARRVRRFAFLPLAGMEEFESAARELASGLAAKDYDRPSLAVTGSVRGEGRTEIAIRLALALAKRTDQRVLLADFDIRKPEVALRLGLSSRLFVLGDVLRGACQPGEALAFSEEDNLHVLASRPPERDGDENLDGRQAEKLMSELHRAFDFVIIDCGPANQADAVIVCRLAGGVILAGRCGSSRVDDMDASGRELASAGVNLAGMILAGA